MMVLLVGEGLRAALSTARRRMRLGLHQLFVLLGQPCTLMGQSAAALSVSGVVYFLSSLFVVLPSCE